MRHSCDWWRLRSHWSLLGPLMLVPRGITTKYYHLLTEKSIRHKMDSLNNMGLGEERNGWRQEQRGKLSTMKTNEAKIVSFTINAAMVLAITISTASTSTARQAVLSASGCKLLELGKVNEQQMHHVKCHKVSHHPSFYCICSFSLSCHCVITVL